MNYREMIKVGRQNIRAYGMVRSFCGRRRVKALRFCYFFVTILLFL